jgi:hypothetical protein
MMTAVNMFFGICTLWVQLISIVWLFDGSRVVARDGLRRKTVVTLAVGSIMCASWVGLNYWNYVGLIELAQVRKNLTHLKPPTADEWSRPASGEEKEEVGRAAARFEFFTFGTLISYLDRNGAWKLFAPSQQEITDREASVKIDGQLETLANDRRNDAFMWAAWGIMAMVSGIVVGKQSKKD